MLIKRVLQAFLCFSLLGASASWAADISGRSSTQVQWFEDFYNGKQVELAQYLRLGINNIDKEGKFTIYGYGRGSQDMTGGDGLNGRLYSLYADYRGLFNAVDVRVGRQFVNLSAGSAIIDGVTIDLKNIGPVGFTVLGGRDVVFGTTGELGYAWNSDFGVSAYLNGFRKTDLDISWLRKFDHSDVARDIVGGSFKQYLLDSVKVYGNARYDITAEVFNELQAGAKYFPTANLVFTGELYQSYATFDATSIYSVFAVNRYREGVLRVDYTINDKVAVNAGYSRQSYGDGARADVYEVGCRLRPVEPLEIGLSYDKRHGYGGNLDGGIFDIAFDVNKSLKLAGGIVYDVYQRDAMTGNESTYKYWGGGKYKLNKNMAASLRVENEVTKTYDSNVQGRFAFDYDF